MNAITSLPQEMRAGLEACAAIARQTASPHAMFNLGTVHLQAGDRGGAETWFREALNLDPNLPEAHQNLAALLQDAGRTDEAKRHRELAFRGNPLRIETAPDERCRVLVFSSAGYGNVPIDYLLPRQTITRIKLFVEYATDADWGALPPYDVAFNAIGDADLVPPGVWQRRVRRERVLNAPDRVARTRRDRLPHLLGGIADVVVPEVCRRSGATSSMKYPQIVRPIGAHGGQGVILAQTPAEIPALLSYLTEFHDYRHSDGQFRKYRIIFVGGEPFPYHLAISSNWLVHYFSADMQLDARKREKERAFLDNPETSLGPRAMAAIRAIGRRLGLAYAGIDFSLLPDGRVLVFEANATMAVHLDDDPVMFDYKHRATSKILEAFGRVLQK